MKCQNCGLINLDIALRCDCGFNFEKGIIEYAYANIPEKQSVVALLLTVVSFVITIASGVISIPLCPSAMRGSVETAWPSSLAIVLITPFTTIAIVLAAFGIRKYRKLLFIVQGIFLGLVFYIIGFRTNLITNLFG